MVFHTSVTPIETITEQDVVTHLYSSTFSLNQALLMFMFLVYKIILIISIFEPICRIASVGLRV